MSRTVTINVTIPVTVSLPDKIPADFDDARIAEAVKRDLADWSDGRYGFSVEMVRNGLCQIVSFAVRTAVEYHFYAKDSRKMVRHRNGSRTPWYVHAAQKVLSGEVLWARPDTEDSATAVVVVAEKPDFGLLGSPPSMKVD